MMQLYVAILLPIGIFIYASDLKTLIGADLSALTAAFVPSLLSDPPRVFNSSRAPTLTTGRHRRGSRRSPRSPRDRARKTRPLVVPTTREREKDNTRDEGVRESPERESEREQARQMSEEKTRERKRERVFKKRPESEREKERERTRLRRYEKTRE